MGEGIKEGEGTLRRIRDNFSRKQQLGEQNENEESKLKEEEKERQTNLLSVTD